MSATPTLPLGPRLPETAEMIRAFLASDASFDGVFFTGVRTTGIFCRPSCPARKPDPSRVSFFATAREALAAGYRPCLRCRPLETGGQPPWLAPLLEEIDRAPERRLKDADLRARGLDPVTVRRHFLARYGLTFHAYCRSRRLAGAFQAIQQGTALDEVTFEAGYESHSGFREAFARVFGEPPGRTAGRDAIAVTWFDSPLGPLVAGASPRGVCLLEFTDRRGFERQVEVVRRLFRCPIVPGRHPLLETLGSELAAYFAGSLRDFSVPVDAPGTPFQQRVWEALRGIPYGETRSYEDLARAVGVPGAPRAVGRANGLNRVAIVVPCHRVVNKDGQLGGYGGGLWRKQFLLDLEQGRRN